MRERKIVYETSLGVIDSLEDLKKIFDDVRSWVPEEVPDSEIDIEFTKEYSGDYSGDIFISYEVS